MLVLVLPPPSQTWWAQCAHTAHTVVSLARCHGICLCWIVDALAVSAPYAATPFVSEEMSTEYGRITMCWSERLFNVIQNHLKRQMSHPNRTACEAQLVPESDSVQLCSYLVLSSLNVICSSSSVGMFWLLPVFGSGYFIVTVQFVARAHYIWTFCWGMISISFSWCRRVNEWQLCAWERKNCYDAQKKRYQNSTG